MLLDTKVCDVCLQNNAGYTGRLIRFDWFFSATEDLGVMMAAVIDITNEEQREVVRRLFRESGNVNVKTPTVSFSCHSLHKYIEHCRVIKLH